MKWQDRAVQVRENHNWNQTYEIVKSEYPELGLKNDQIRDAVRWRTRDRAKPKEPVDIHEATKKALVKGSTAKEIAETTGKTERLILAAIEDLMRPSAYSGKVERKRRAITQRHRTVFK